MDDDAWAVTSAATVARDRLHVVVLGDVSKPRAVAALAQRAGGLEPLGASELFEPADVLAASADDRAELVDGLVRMGRPLRLRRAPADSATVLLLRAQRRARAIVREAEPAPTIPLTEAWTQIGGGLGSRRRSDLHRAMHRTHAEGELRIDLLRPDPDDVPALLDEAFAVEDRSWKGRAGTSLARDERRAAFFRRSAVEAARRGQLRVDFQRIGDSTAAMQVAVEWRERLWLLKIGYDEAFARCSPGVVLLAHAITDAARRGLASYELLGGDRRWVRAWTAEMRPMLAVAMYPLRPRVAVTLVRDAACEARGVAGRAPAHRAVEKAASAARDLIARRYVAGATLEDALRLDTAYRERGLLTTVGYFDGPRDDARQVIAEYSAQAAALARRPGAELSVKLPSIEYDASALAALLQHHDVGLHLDSLAPDVQTAVLDVACDLAAIAPGRVGCTLAGRWPRSVIDAHRVADRCLRVRVVKSQWPSPDDPERDARAGFLGVVKALVAARPPLVAIATHDVPLARRALEALLEAGIRSELQVLHGRRAGGIP